MARGVATVWVPVDDIDRAVKFYEETLGLTVKGRDGDWAEVDADGVSIGLNARESTHDGHGGGAVISFQPDGDLAQEVDRLSQAGVTFVGDVAEHPWGKIAAFKDSEGNDLQLYAPPNG